MNKAYSGEGIAADGAVCTREYFMALGPYSRDELVNFMNEQRARSIYVICMESKGWQQLPSEKWKQDNCPAIRRRSQETGTAAPGLQWCQ